MRRAMTTGSVFALAVLLAVGDGFSDLVQDDSPPGNQRSNSPLAGEESSSAAENEVAFAPRPLGTPQPDAGDGLSVSLLNPANRVKLTAGLDALMVFSSKRVFPSGIPLFLYPDSPFGLETNEFDAHARQSYVGGIFTGPELCGLQTGAQVLTFFQNHDLSADDYGLLVYYAFGELKNDQWRFAAGLQQDVFNPTSPSVVYLTKMYGSGNTGSYRGQFRVERMFQGSDALGLTLQTALSDPLSTLVTGSAGRITEDNGWPNVETRIELGVGPRSTIRGSQVRPLEFGVSGVVGQFRTTRTIIGDPSDLPPRAVIDTWGLGSDIQWWITGSFGARGEFYCGEGLGEYNGGVLQSFNSATLEGVRTAGGFAEVFYYLTDALHVHTGFGVDDPCDQDLYLTQIRRNTTYFVNFVWDLSKAAQLSLQLDYRTTDYTQFQPDALLDSDALIVATRFLWRF